jgi:hypothetical protein
MRRSGLAGSLCGVSSVACLAMLPFVGGCTYGRVTDAATGSSTTNLLTGTGIQGATLVFEGLDVAPDQTITNEAKPAVLQKFPSPVQTWTAAELAAGGDSANLAGSYWLNPYASEHSGDSTVTLVSPGWNRVQVSAPGYDTAFVYRNHQYQPNEVQTQTPYSGPGTSNTPATAPYPVPTFNLVQTSSILPTTTFGDQTLAALENFALWRAPIVVSPEIDVGGIVVIPAVALFDHVKLPDLIIDVRSLLMTDQIVMGDQPPSAYANGPPGTIQDPRFGTCPSNAPLDQLLQECPLIGENASCPFAKCLAYSVNCANVGSGNFEVFVPSNTGPLQPVTQFVSNAVAPPASETIAGGSLTQHGNLWKVTGLIATRLRGPIVPGCGLAPPAAGCCDTEPTAQNCPVATSESKDICLTGGVGEGVSEIFDQDIKNFYGASQNARTRTGGMNCFANGVGDGAANGPVDQGLGPGFAEIYPFGNPGNFLDISNVAAGTYWLEVEINPSQAYQESDYSNNIARAQVTIGQPAGSGSPPQ